VSPRFINICAFYRPYHTLTRLNYIYSATLMGMGQQLAAISAGIGGIAAGAGTTPSVVPGLPPATFPGRVQLPQQPDREDFPKIVHWDRELYKRLRKLSKGAKGGKPEQEDSDDHGHGDPELIQARAIKIHKELVATGTAITSCYMEDADGTQISVPQKHAARGRAKGFWNGLVQDRATPPASLGKVDSETRDRFVALLEKEFPWLGYCESHWKAEQIWINHYGSWLKNLRKEGGVAVKAEANSDDEDEVGDEEKAPKRPQEGGETSKSKRPRVDEKESTPPPPPRPAAAKITTARIRVRLFILSNYTRC
jgi:hypothetical protein